MYAKMENIIQIALSQNDVDFLFHLWRLALVQSSQDRFTEQIESGLPELAENLGLRRPNSFRRLVKTYDLKTYKKMEGTVDEKLIIFTKRGNRYLISRCINKGAEGDIGAYEATRMGDIPLLNYFLEMDDVSVNRQKLFHIAAFEGHLHVVKWLCSSGSSPDQDCLNHSAKGERLDVFKWLLKHYCDMDENTYENCCTGSGTKILDYLRDNDCPWNENLLMFAASVGKLHVVIWASQNGWPMDERVPIYAAKGGHLHVLQWLVTNGCPWNKWTCIYAIIAWQFDVLKWAYENGCEYDESVYEKVLETNNKDLIQWFADHPR